MPYVKSYTAWADYPATTTPIAAAKLQNIDDGVLNADNRPGSVDPIIDYAAIGNGTTDDQAALQLAANYAATNSLWLDGRGKTYAIGQPLIVPAGALWRNINLKALAGFTPVDTTNAALINQQGKAYAFTADPTTDIITTASPHGIPSDGSKTVFQGTGLPSPLVSGRVYYAYNRTASTFTVSSVTGGATVDITTSGSGGTAYTEVRSLNKLRFRDVFLNLNGVAGLNGADFSLQQQSQLIAFRVTGGSSTTLFCYRLNGQQAEHFDVELGCATGGGTCLVIDNASFMHFFGLDIEKFQTGVQFTNGGGATNVFVGVHMENTSGPDTAVFWDVTNGTINLDVESCTLSMKASGSDTQVGFDLGAASTAVSGRLADINVSGAGPTGSALEILVRDNNRLDVSGNPLVANVWADASGASTNGHISELLLPKVTTSYLYTDEYGGLTVWGQKGKVFRVGMQRGVAPMVVQGPASDQTVDQHMWLDTAGVQAAGVTKDGNLWAKTIRIGSATGTALSATGSGSEWDYKQIVAPVAIAATAEGVATTVIDSNSITYDGTKVLVACWCPGVVRGTATFPFTGVLLRDSTVIGQWQMLTAGNDFPACYMAVEDTPSAAAHTYHWKVFAAGLGGSPQVSAGAGGTGNLMPAFLRVTKV